MTEQEIEETRKRLEATGQMPAGRSGCSRTVEVSVLLDRQETARLDELAAAEGRSRSWMIREAIRRTWLKRRRPSVSSESNDKARLAAPENQ